MADSVPARVPSALLEDMAIVALTARSIPDLHPKLDEKRRGTLRARLKHISRHGWPATIKDDALLRQGYTLRQCFRLVIALVLIDAHLAPSLAIPLSANNEVAFFRTIAARLSAAPTGSALPANDLICVIIVGELWEQVDTRGYQDTAPHQVRVIERGAAADSWSASAGLDVPGQRLLIDVGASAQAVWSWMSGRRLMPAGELDALLADIAAQAAVPGFGLRMERQVRR